MASSRKGHSAENKNGKPVNIWAFLLFGEQLPKEKKALFLQEARTNTKCISS